MVVKDLSIWCLGPQWLVTFLFKELRLEITLLTYLHQNTSYASHDVDFVHK